MHELSFIDGHNDTITKLMNNDISVEEAFLKGNSQTHLDFPRAKESGFAGGFFAAFTAPQKELKGPEHYITAEGYRIPLPEALDYEYCHRKTNAVIADLYRLEAASANHLQIIRSYKDLEAALAKKVMAVILHIEGAEAIDAHLDALHVYYEAGLRSLGLVWSRPNIFAEGVPYQFPSSPDTGNGLTKLGKHLVRKCNELGIMIDNSHLNEKGFWDVAALSDSPLVATHSNAHSLCPISRNLTDKQLDAIAESNGVVGITYSNNMLRMDGDLSQDTAIEDIVKHITYISNRVGVEHVALGSDFDGAVISKELKDVTGVPKILQRLNQSGFTDSDIKKLSSENWLRITRNTWK
ncbi:dipeptidase [Halobacillus salinarum]|uniref:Dipeptidase n=1 Tax=Halobacillus salinarum TaxID=2932257 RepID=A0ABY4EGL8_9BACI|nr:dipeptidase [Halobacillus salinarum]UOQ42764.1 dipeptidase [Halobacillus salinarum]